MKFLLRLFSLVLLVVAAIVIYLAIYRGPMPEAGLIVPVSGMQGTQLTAKGAVVADLEYEVRAKTEGYLRGFEQSEGQQVAKGESLGFITNRDEGQFDLQIGKLRSAQETKAVQLKIAKENYNRLQRGFDQGIVPGNDVLKERQNVELAESEMDSLQRELSLVSRLDRDQKRSAAKNRDLVSLADGVLTEKWVTSGEWITKGKLLGKVVTTDKLKIKANLLPAEAQRLKPGDSVMVSTMEKDQRWEEQVLRISPIISDRGENNHLQEVVISNQKGKSLLGINTRVDLQFQQEAPSEQLTLPLDAVFKMADTFHILKPDYYRPVSFAEVREKRGLGAALKHAACGISECYSRFVPLKAVPVETGNTNLNQVGITSGLNAGEPVIMPNINTQRYDVIVLDKS